MAVAGSGDALGVHGFIVMAVAAALFVAVGSRLDARRNASVRNRPRFGTDHPQALRPMTRPRARLPVTSRRHAEACSFEQPTPQCDEPVRKLCARG